MKAIVLLACLWGATTSAAASDLVRTRHTKVNIRMSPGVNQGTVLNQVNRLETFEKLGSKRLGKGRLWYKVRSTRPNPNGNDQPLVGWVSAKYFEDAKTEAQGPCPTCGIRPPVAVAGLRPVTSALNQASQNFMDRFASQAVANALRPRLRADFLGGGMGYGNRSKGMCASAVKENLMALGLCKSRPAGHAIDMASSLRSCHGLQRGPLTTPLRAPAGSVIVYRTTRHEFGHVEVKVKATADILRRYPSLNYRIGQELYCSDFCRPRPTWSDKYITTAIYSM